MAEVTSVLVVEDDPEIRDLVEGLLAREGFRVTAVGDGAAMDRAMARATPDLVILDVMLPGEDGLSICRRLRANTAIPLLMLTAKGDDVDRIVGLEMGADDYLPKPFNPRELVARIRAVLRRASAPAASGPSARRLVFADWIVDLDAREVRRSGGETLELTSAEFDLLAAFVTHPQRVLNRDQLLDWTQGRLASPLDRSIDVQVSRLRKKIEPDARNPTLIKTVRNGGYSLTVAVREA